MIGKLTGIIDTTDTGHLILDVQGVGYLVQASARTLSRIGGRGDKASLLIETHVREDAISLYGFADKAEQRWFKLLTGVQGVGAKVGLSILGACPPESLSVAIAAQDKAALTRADGVGPKLAVRIVTELKDKAAALDTGTPEKSAIAAKGAKPAEDSAGGIAPDAVSALVNLGYARSEAYTAVMNARAKANDNDRDNLSALIRLALKELAS